MVKTIAEKTKEDLEWLGSTVALPCRFLRFRQGFYAARRHRVPLRSTLLDCNLICCSSTWEVVVDGRHPSQLYRWDRAVPPAARQRWRAAAVERRRAPSDPV